MAIERRRLGRTGLMVSVLGFGGARIQSPPYDRPQIPPEESERMVRYAFDQGINFFDTCRGYYHSEETIGAALSHMRDDCILATKVMSRTKNGAWVELKQSLRKLRADRIDVIQVHGVDTVDDLQTIVGPGGCIEAFKEARSEGLVDHIGLSSHRPHVAVEALRTGEFEVVVAPINVIARGVLEELVPLAKELDVGVVVMKPFGGPYYYYFGSAEFKSLLGKDPYTIARRGLDFLLRREVSSILSGFHTRAEVEASVRAVRDFDPGAPEERFEFWDDEGGRYCREGGTLAMCERCMPCPELLNIPLILRYDRFYGYGVKDWARGMYGTLPTKVEDCTRCGECEERCPYGLPVVKLLQRACQRLR